MEHEDPLKRGSVDDAELDAQLAALFRSVEPPAPSPDFTARTLRAVRQAPLDAGRRPLRDPLTSLVGWAAVIAAAALSALAVLSQPAFASAFGALVRHGVGVGVWLMQFRGPALAVVDVLATTGHAVARAAATTEGTTGLILMATVAALSLLALHRLLTSEGERQPWQEVS